MEIQGEYDWREWELKKQDFLKFCMEGKWGKVVYMCDQYPSLQNDKLTATGETVLHVAVSESTEEIVNMLVESAEQPERTWQTRSPLLIQNAGGNTPLHLAALNGNVGMCMCIAGKHEELVGIRNKAGETPLFLAALRGKKDAFLYLHQLCDPQRQHEYYRRGRDGETILHVAIIGEYFDLAYQIICKYDQLIYAVNENGYTPLHLLATKPAVFRSGSRLDGFINRILYYCLHIEKLKVSRPRYYFQPTEDTEKYPEKHKTCINFFQTLLKMLHKMIKIPVTCRENWPTSKKHTQANDAIYREDPEERHDDTRHNQGKRSSNIEAEERHQLFPPNHHTCIMIIKPIRRAMLVILELIVHLIAMLFGLRNERKKMQAKKEKNIWSVQIMNLMLLNSLLHHSSSSGCHPGTMQDFSDKDEPKDSVVGESKDSRTFVKTREPPILLAAKNGITEMVSAILASFPMAVLDRDSVGKNIVLLAVENRQTQLYAQLLRNIAFYESAFRAVDNNGNSALHVAATLGDYQPYPFAALQMQWEIKWYKYVKHSVPRDFFTSRNNKSMTPKEVFRESHEYLVIEGRKWLTGTSKSCSVVATLVTTVAFATTATVPGGMREGSSRPNLERHPGFIVFAISSLMALSFSVTSVIAFLSILTSRYDQKDFQSDLPKKLMFALTSLFISLSAMLVCFCSGHFFLVKDEFEHTAYLVMYAIACLPVAYFAMMQFPFYFALIFQTFKKVPQRTPFR